MKKIVMILIMLLLAIMFLQANAEIDLQSMSYDELVNLQARLTDELSKRNSDTLIHGAWGAGALGKLAPDPRIVFDRETERNSKLFLDTDDAFFDTVTGVTDEEFELYCEALQDYGFINNMQMASTAFQGERDSGEYVIVLYGRDHINVEIKPKK